MYYEKSVNRRQFLSLMGAGAALAWTGLKPASASLLDKRLPGLGSSTNFKPDVELALRAVETQVSILSGIPTRVWSYDGELLKGDPANLQNLLDSYLGPIIRVQTGQKVRVHFINQLSEQSIVHRPETSLTLQPGTYRFRVLNGLNARMFKLGWQDGQALTVIATDGGLLNVPVQRDYVTLAPGERVELLVQLSESQAGLPLLMQSHHFSDGMSGMPGDGMNPILPNGDAFDVLSVQVAGESPAHHTFLPSVIAGLRGTSSVTNTPKAMPMKGMTKRASTRATPIIPVMRSCSVTASGSVWSSAFLY